MTMIYQLMLKKINTNDAVFCFQSINDVAPLAFIRALSCNIMRYLICISVDNRIANIKDLFLQYLDTIEYCYSSVICKIY